MAQAIALEYYAVELDRQLEIFMKMNANIQSSKNFRNMDDQELIKMVASNNIVMTNVLSKVISATVYMYEDNDKYLTYFNLLCGYRDS